MLYFNPYIMTGIMIANVVLLLFAIYLFLIRRARLHKVDVLWLAPLLVVTLLLMIGPVQLGEEPWQTVGSLMANCTLPGGPPCTTLGRVMLNLQNYCPLLALAFSPFGLLPKRERRARG